MLDGTEASSKQTIRRRSRLKPENKVHRILLVIDWFTYFRKQGIKRSSCITETVNLIRREYPKIPISDRTARRILAEYQGANSEHAVRMDRKSQEEVDRQSAALHEQVQELFGCKRLVHVSVISLGPSPKHSRSNAAATKRR